MGCKDECQTKGIINLTSKGSYLLLQEGLQSGKGCAFCCNRNKDTLLIIATKLGHVEAVNVLLDHFGNDYIEYFNKTGKRALHEAAQNCQLEIAQILLDRGADVNALKQGDWTPLMLAVEKSNLEMTQMLLERGAYTGLSNKDGWNAFHIAARSGSVDILSILHSSNDQLILTVSKNGRTPLHSAAMNNSIVATDWLLKHGLPLDLVDSSGLTPLMDGARMGHLTVCEILLKFGANILQLDTLQRTILHHVTQAGELEMLKWCVEEAERKQRETTESSSPNQCTTSKHQKESFVNWRSGQGSTALHYAVKESRCKEIRALLGLGADPEIADRFGRTPIQMTDNDDVRLLLN